LSYHYQDKMADADPDLEHDELTDDERILLGQLELQARCEAVRDYRIPGGVRIDMDLPLAHVEALLGHERAQGRPGELIQDILLNLVEDAVERLPAAQEDNDNEAALEYLLSNSGTEGQEERDDRDRKRYLAKTEGLTVEDLRFDQEELRSLVVILARKVETLEGQLTHVAHLEKRGYGTNQEQIAALQREVAQLKR
jgi:hypothetical protein